MENFADSICDKYSSINRASELLLAEELLNKTDPEYAKNLGKQMVKTLLRNPWKRGGYAALRQVIYGFLSAHLKLRSFWRNWLKLIPLGKQCAKSSVVVVL